MLNERAALRIVGVLIAINAVLTGWIAASHLEPFADLATYYQAAQNIAQGKGYSLDIKIVANAARTDAPFPVGDRFLYPLLVAAALRLFGDSLAVANVVSAISMSLVAVPLFFLGRALFDWRAGLLAVGLYTLSPFYHAIGIGGWTDLTATLFYYGCLACAAQCVLHERASLPRSLSRVPLGDMHRQEPDIKAKRRASVWPLLTGLLFALAALTREDAVVLALALGFAWWMRGRNLRDGLAFLAFPACAFVLRGVYLWQNFGSPFYNERPYFLLPRWALWYYLGSFSPGDYLDYVGGFGGAVAIRLYNYARFIENLFSDGTLYFTQTGLLPLVMVVPIATAYARHIRDKRFKLLLCFSGVAALQLLLGIGYPGYAGNSTEVRHGQLIAPFLLLLAAGGLVALWDAERSRRALALAFGGIYLAFSVAYLGAWGVTLNVPPYRGPIVLAAEWARDHLPAGAVLMTRRAAEAHYFSSKTVVVTPSAPFSEMMAYARAHHITHFLIADDERTGTPNLLQGMRVFAQNFRTVYSTGGVQIVAVSSYDFPASLSLPDELYAGKTVGRPSQLFSWDTLLPSGAGTIMDAFGSWGELYSSLSHPAAADQPLARDVNLRAGDAIELVRYALVSGSLSRGDELSVTAYWRALAQPKSNYTVFVHLLDATGRLRAQKDSPPMSNARPTSVWDAGEWLEDPYVMTVPDDAQPGQYMLEIGLYDSATGTRLPLLDPAGNRLANDRLLVEGLSVR